MSKSKLHIESRIKELDKEMQKDVDAGVLYQTDKDLAMTAIREKLFEDFFSEDGLSESNKCSL